MDQARESIHIALTPGPKVKLSIAAGDGDGEGEGAGDGGARAVIEADKDIMRKYSGYFAGLLDSGMAEAEKLEVKAGLLFIP